MLIDTCVLSEGSKSQANARVLEWLQTHDQALCLSVVTLGEVRFGWHLMAQGPRHHFIGGWIERVETIFATRIFPINQAVMSTWAELRARRQRLGRPLPLADGLIAATALQHGMPLATRNTPDFADLGLRLYNPWEG